MIRYAHRLNGFTQLALTKVDVLSGLKELKICTHYQIGKNKITEFPSLQNEFAKARPVYQSFAGWSDDLTQIKKFTNLPKATQKYLNFIEQQLNIPIKYISVSPERKAVIIK